jgi:hypothetical protein
MFRCWACCHQTASPTRSALNLLSAVEAQKKVGGRDRDGGVEWRGGGGGRQREKERKREGETETRGCVRVAAFLLASCFASVSISPLPCLHHPLPLIPCPSPSLTLLSPSFLSLPPSLPHSISAFSLSLARSLARSLALSSWSSSEARRAGLSPHTLVA